MSSNAVVSIARYVQLRQNQDVHSVESAEVVRALADTVSVAIAGINTEGIERALTVMTCAGGSGKHSIWGSEAAVSESTAAFVNAAAAHILDFDDVASPLRGHPSTVLFPVLCALSEDKEFSGKQVSAAYITGYNVMCAISKAMIQRHYPIGWHPTCTIGIIGAAAAAAHLLGFDEQHSQNVVGLAVSQASGSRIQFGTDAKWLQVGFAASNAVTCVRLAQAGMTASQVALDNEEGGFNTLYHGEDVDELRWQLDSLLSGRDFFAEYGLDVKKYPMCYATHRAVDALREILAVHFIDASDVDRVEVLGSNQAFVPLIHSQPQMPLEAKFSMNYAIAGTFIDGSIHLASFREDQVQRTEIQALMSKVFKSEDAGTPVFPRRSTVTVYLKDGRQFSATMQEMTGSKNKPLTDQERLEKINSCLTFAGLPGWDSPLEEQLSGWYEEPASMIINRFNITKPQPRRS